MDRSPRLGTPDRSPARSAHTSRTHPGNERRQLPPQAEPTQTNPILQALNDTPPNAPRGRRASSATLQRPFYPAYPTTRSCNYWPTFTPPQWPSFTPPLTEWEYGKLLSPKKLLTLRSLLLILLAQHWKRFRKMRLPLRNSSKRNLGS